MKKKLILIFGIFLLSILGAMFLTEAVSVADFNVGDTVEIYNTGSSGLKVRYPDECSSSYVVKFDGTRGSVLSGPYYCDGYYRWKIRWSDGFEGWSAEDWLRKVSITPSTKFSIGNRVKVNANGVNVRNDPPELASLGSVNTGDVGTVVAGPFYGVPKGSSGFYYFWKIDYDTKTDGWTAENYLDKVIQCQGTDTSCGTTSCVNCNNNDGCSGDYYRNYYCSSNSAGCSYTSDNCNDCSCSCGGYNTQESTANGNCNDGKDNDCDGSIDSSDSGCYTCTPKTCSQLGKSCGSWDDGCGSNINCGSCPSGQFCDNGVCKTNVQYINGIDVSGYQHPGGKEIKWTEVYNEGYRFVFVKATQRNNYTNPYFKSDMNSGKNASILVGAYHFACPSYNLNQYCYGTSAEVEAQHFLDVAGDYLIQGYLRPALDIDQPICNDFYNSDNCLGLRNWIDKWMDIIKTKKGVAPILYTGPYCIRDCLGSSFAKKYDLWIARYGSSPCPFPNCDWDWAFWQYTDQGNVLGISGNVDLDKFNGSMDRLNTFLISVSNNPPTIIAFSVSPLSVNLGNSFTISYTAMDDNGLVRAELYRAVDNNGQPANWNETNRTSISGTTYSGSFSDAPNSAGAYWYGVHVVDSEGKWNDERNSETGGLPGVYGPIKVNVVSCTNDCSSGQTRCNGNIKQTCGNYDADTCLEWGGDFNCGNDYCESWQANYCKNNSVYHNRTCHGKGCSSGVCYDNTNIEEQLVENCNYGCGNGNCTQKLQGDVNGNCKVDIFDLAAVGLCYGQAPTGTCANADLNKDGSINIFDLATVGLNYGKIC